MNAVVNGYDFHHRDDDCIPVKELEDVKILYGQLGPPLCMCPLKMFEGGHTPVSNIEELEDAYATLRETLEADGHSDDLIVIFRPRPGKDRAFEL